MEKNREKTPFRDLVNKLREIKDRPLSDEQVDKINAIIEKDDNDSENVVPEDKIAMPEQQIEGCNSWP